MLSWFLISHIARYAPSPQEELKIGEYRLNNLNMSQICSKYATPN